MGRKGTDRGSGPSPEALYMLALQDSRLSLPPENLPSVKWVVSFVLFQGQGLMGLLLKMAIECRTRLGAPYGIRLELASSLPSLHVSLFFSPFSGERSIEHLFSSFVAASL